MRLAHSAEPSVAAPAVSEPVEEVAIGSLEDMVALAEKHRDIAMKVQIRTGVRLVRIEPGRLEINLAPDASPSLPGELIKKLGDWTGAKWSVALSREEGAPTLAERETAKREALVSDARQDPDVAAILARFPALALPMCVSRRLRKTSPPRRSRQPRMEISFRKISNPKTARTERAYRSGRGAMKPANNTRTGKQHSKRRPG